MYRRAEVVRQDMDVGALPKIKCVICGLANAAYVRPDGIFVVPITALKK